MNISAKSLLLACAVLLLARPASSQNNTSSLTPSTEKHMQEILIDKLTVPRKAKEEFTQRMHINRNILKQIPGFVKDDVYERTEENGNLVYITVAVWENAEALKKAKELVEAEYKRSGFNVAEFCKKLDIKIERGIYQRTGN